MKVKALRGVCIGVDRHMKPGDTEDLDAAQVTFLVGIGAVETVTEPAFIEPQAKFFSEQQAQVTPAKAGKKEK